MMAAGFILAFRSTTVIVPNTQPYKVLNKEVSSEETLKYVVDACKYREAPTQVIRKFVDEQGVAYSLPPQESNVPVGCKKSTIPVIIPETLHKGKWYLSLDVAYKVNPLRTESYHFKTESFEIK